MTLWLIDPNQTRHRLIDRFAPVFYVSGPDAVLRRLRGEAARQPHALACRATERMDLWEQRARPVLEIEVAHPNEFASWTRWVRQFDSALRLYNSDLMLASLYCWQRGVFPLARVEVEADGEGRVLALECRDTEWAIDYEPPPLEILRVRLGGLKGIADPRHGSQDRARNRGGRTPVRTRRSGRARRRRLPASARAARSRPDPERLGRRHDPAAAARTGREAASAAHAQPRSLRRNTREPRAQLHELRPHPVQEQRDHAVRPPARGHAEFVHRRQVRPLRTLGTRAHHQTPRAVLRAHLDRHRHLLHADGTGLARRRAHPRAKSRAGRSQAARRIARGRPRRPGLHAENRLSRQRRRTRFRQRVSEHHGPVQHFARDGQLPVLSRRAARARAGLPRLPAAARHHQPRRRAAHRQAQRAEEV